MSERLATTLGEICDGDRGIQTGPFGNQLHAEEYSDEGLPVVMPQDLGNNTINTAQIARVPEHVAARLARHQLRAGDIVFSRRGDVTRRALVGESNVGWLCGTGCLRARPGGSVDSRFLSYLLGTAEVRDWLNGNAVGTNMLNLNTTILGRLPLLIPGLPEQQAIAEVLGALDDKIATNTALAGKATSTIAAGYTVAMSDGFVERPLLQTLTVEFGESFGGKLFSAPGVGRPLIRIRDLRTFESQVWTTETRPSEVVVAPGDVLVGMDAEFRATQWLGDSGLMNQRVLRASHPTYGQALVREVLKKPLAEIENEKSATTVIHLNKSDLARKTVYLPTPASISAFEATAEPLYELCVALAAENRTLAATRDALLPQLMSGALRIRDAEAMVSTVGATIRTGANDER